MDRYKRVKLSKRPIRVLHILGELKHSGAEIMYHAAAQMWSTEQIHCDILSIGQDVGVMASVLDADGYRIHHFPFSRSPIHLWSVYRFLLRSRFEAVHIDVERGNFWYGLLARLAGTPRIFRTIHSVFAFQGSLKMRRRWQRRLLRFIGLITITIGDSVARNELQRFGNPSLQIPNWFDNRRFVPPTPAERLAGRERLSIPDGSLVLISIGNCAQVKNHPAILQALALLPRDLPLIYLHVGSEGADSSERALAAALRVSNKVRFYGFAEDILPLLHSADIFIMPSYHEGFSCAALEAIGTGLPAILSDVPGLRDLRSVWTEVCWTDITPQSIADAINSSCQTSPQQRRKVGLRGSHAIHQSFGLSNGARKYVDLYRECNSRTKNQMRRPRVAVGKEF